MDKLKEAIAAKRKAAGDEFQGKKYVKRGDLERVRLQKLRDEEEQERREKVRCSPLARAGDGQPEAIAQLAAHMSPILVSTQPVASGAGGQAPSTRGRRRRADQPAGR